MTKAEIIEQLHAFFSDSELVCDHTYKKYRSNSWEQFLDKDFLECLLIIRKDILCRPMKCNYGSYTQRGLRCNLCKLVRDKTEQGRLYLSQHLMGKAGDFTIEGMTAEQARQKIKAKADMLPCKIRVESGVSWLHFDVMDNPNIQDKVYFFKG